MVLARGGRGDGAGEGAGDDGRDPLAPKNRAPSDQPIRVRFTLGSIVRSVLVVAAFFVLAAVVVAAATPLVWFVEGVIGAALLFPAVVGLSRKMPHAAAVAVLSVGIVVVVVAVGLRLFSELRDEANQFQQNAPQLTQQVESNPTVGSAAKQFGLGDKVQNFANDIAGAFNFSGASVSTISTVASLGSAVFAVWLFGVMMLFSAPGFIRGAMNQMGGTERGDRIGAVLAVGYWRSWQYFAAMLVRSAAYGTLTWVVAFACGLQAPTLLAVWVAVWSFVPSVGLLIGGLLVAAVALFSSFWFAGGALLTYVLAQLLDARFVTTQIHRRTVKIGPSLTLAAAIIGFGLYGFGGTVIACVLLFFAIAVLDELRPDPAERSRDEPDTPLPA
jgi:predicted PurR-regulated permease PerM